MTLTKAERATAMRDMGVSIETIARHFGWSYGIAKCCISRGRKVDYYNAKQRDYARRRKPETASRCGSWPEAHAKIVQAAYGQIPARMIAPLVGRSRNAVIGKARRLGLSVPA